jgi:predicted acylesterase/phospholipase RssA
MMEKSKTKKKSLKIGLALGGGAAKGLAHIGVLKAFHKHNIYPDMIAGSSMGSIIGAAYAAGNTPDVLEEYAESIDFQSLLDFNLPWIGIIKGKKVEGILQDLTHNKDFKELKIPFQTIAYNLTKRRREVFHDGNLVKAIRASISLPGIFTPARIGKNQYIDGGVIDPCPVDLLKDMGADIIISVELFHKTSSVKAPKVKTRTFLQEFKESFIAEELLVIENYIEPKRWPKFLRKLFRKLFNKFLYPAKVLRMLQGKELPEIIKTMFVTQDVMFIELAKEKSRNSIADIKIIPEFKAQSWYRFYETKHFVDLGENTAEEKINEIKKLLRKRS